MIARICVVFACLCLVPTAAVAELRVVATTPDLAAIAKAVGAGHAEVSALALPTQDPHFVDARPHLALDLSRADLLIAVGLSLEVGWLPTLQVGARNPAIQVGAKGYLDCSQFAELLEVPTAKIERSMGDIHPGGNPHYMYDPRQAVRVAAGIAKRMAELDPKHAADFERGARQVQTDLDGARKRWEQELAPLRGIKAIAYHKSLSYLANWLGLQIVEHVEPKPGIPPNPRHVAQLLALAREQGVKLFVQETFYPTNTSQMLADRAGARLVTLPSSPDFSHGKTYVDFMNDLVARLHKPG
jgi:zinc/manganese transport system substrate-binding protein